jgi:hypothetical protein
MSLGSQSRWGWVCLALPPVACALSLALTRLVWEWSHSRVSGERLGVFHIGLALIDLGNLVLAFALLWRSNYSGARAIFNRELLAGCLSLCFALFHLVVGCLAVAQIR